MTGVGYERPEFGRPCVGISTVSVRRERSRFLLPFMLAIHDADGESFNVISNGAEVIAVLLKLDRFELGGEAREFYHVVVHGVRDGFEFLLPVSHNQSSLAFGASG